MSDSDNRLYDKRIIDEIKKRYDLSTEAGVKGAYSKLQTVHFKTAEGNRFDDEIFDLYQSIKTDRTKLNVVKPETSQVKIDDKPSLDKSSAKKKQLQAKQSTDIDKAARKIIAKKNKTRIMVIFVLFLVAGGSIGYFVKYYSDAAKVEQSVENFNLLKDPKFADILKDVTPVVKKEYDEEVVIPDILDEYLALYNKNKSLIGWINIADTNIDYPVMQSNDNEYYLKHNFNQEKDSNGCIFLDCNCDVVLGNDNFILYGHHMKNGKMFSSIIKYANYDFYKEHKYISFDTIYEKGTYEVMYAFRSRIYNSDEVTFKYYQFIDANSAEEFDSYMEEMDKLSLIKTDVTAVYGDRLLTLSTCDYQEDKNGRFVVVAKKIN